MRIVSAKTGKLSSYAPRVGVGVNDGAFAVRLALARRLAPEPARPARPEDRATEGRPDQAPVSRPARWRRPRTPSGSRSSRQRAARPAAQDRPEDRPDARDRLLPVRDRVAHGQPDRALGRRAPPRPRPARRPQDRRGASRRSASATTARGHRLRPRLAVGGHAGGQRRLQDHDRHRQVHPDQRRPAAAPARGRRRTSSTSPTTARATSTRST